MALAVGVAATVLGTIIPSLFGTDSTGRLIGMLAGGLIVAVISVAGPWERERRLLGLVAAIAAILLTYSGGRAADPQLFPTPAEIRESVGHIGGETDDPSTIRANGVGMRLDRTALSCGSSTDCGSVTITSVGSNPLELHDIGFEEGPNPAEFTESGTCDNHAALRNGETCRFGVEFHPSVRDGGDREATLLIHQNVGNEIARVGVSGTADVIDDLALAPDVTCSYAGEQLTIAFAVRHTGEIPDAFDATAQSTDPPGQPVTRRFLVDDGTAPELSLPVAPVAADTSVTLSVDSGVDEQDADNNRMALTAHVTEDVVNAGGGSIEC